MRPSRCALGTAMKLPQVRDDRRTMHEHRGFLNQQTRFRVPQYLMLFQSLEFPFVHYVQRYLLFPWLTLVLASHISSQSEQAEYQNEENKCTCPRTIDGILSSNLQHAEDVHRKRTDWSAYWIEDE